MDAETLGRKTAKVELAEELSGAGAANAVTNLGRAGFDDVLAPGTHEGGRMTHDIDPFFHD